MHNRYLQFHYNFNRICANLVGDNCIHYIEFFIPNSLTTNLNYFNAILKWFSRFIGGLIVWNVHERTVWHKGGIKLQCLQITLFWVKLMKLIKEVDTVSLEVLLTTKSETVLWISFLNDRRKIKKTVFKH